MLSGEYLVLDGAQALSLPTQKGQSMEVKRSSLAGLQWEGLLVDGSTWFQARYDARLNLLDTDKPEVAERLKSFLKVCLENNPDFVSELEASEVTTQLEFESDWGLGSSSTLLHMLGAWSKVDPFVILRTAFKGSGYDIASAGTDRPIVYHLEGNDPHWKEVDFAPAFAEDLYFVYLNQKQNSREGIEHYRSLQEDKSAYIRSINQLTDQMLHCTDLGVFEDLLEKHEGLMSYVLQMETVKSRLFSDYPGAIKSLGAWGGDFVLATRSDAKDYFRAKGYDVVIPYEEMIKAN